MVTKLLFCLLLLLSLLPRSFALPPESVPDAVGILANAGFLSMALTLEFGSQVLVPQSPSLTIFTPPDAVFAKSGQPPLYLLQLHFSPLYLSLQTLRSLFSGAKIPTMSHNRSLIVTTLPSDNRVSLNGVKVEGYPLYDDGSLVIFRIEDFFHPNFQLSSPIQSPSSGTVRCRASMNDDSMGSSDEYSFKRASQALKSRGYSIMAGFLDMQVGRIGNQALLTVFAPVDDSFIDHLCQFNEYPSLFLSHFVPCKITWSDLVSLDDGVELPTYMETFRINITRSGGNLRLNGVSVVAGDIYVTNWLVVHGLDGIILAPRRTEEQHVHSSGLEGNHYQTGRYIFALSTFWLIVLAIGLPF